MAKGGARAQSGPAPDPNALRRERDGHSWLTLPAEGRPGDPPAWPLTGHSDREADLWVAEWRRPQALEWERNGQELEVALYIRCVIAAESPNARAADRTLVRQQQEALGLSLPGLARNHWRIGEPEAVGVPVVPTRSRFTVVPGGIAV